MKSAKSVAVLFVLALLMAACSTNTTIESTASSQADAESTESDTAESETSDSRAADSGAVESEAAESETSESDSETTEAPADEPTPEPAATEPPPAPTVDTSGAAALIGADDWCTAARLVEDQFDELDVIGFGDPDAVKQAYINAGATIKQARELAPPVIAGDVDTTIQGVELLIDVLEQAEWDFLAVDFSALDALDGEMNTASYNIEKYNFDVCGIGEEPIEPLPLDESPFTTEDGEPITGTVGEQITQSLVESGFTQVEAECIISGVDFGDVEAMADPSIMLDVFADCGIPFERLAELGG